MIDMNIISSAGLILAIAAIILWIWKVTKDSQLEEKRMIAEINKEAH